MEIPFGPFTLLLIDAASLIHCVGDFSGDRFVITGFIDRDIAAGAGAGCEWFKAKMDEYPDRLAEFTAERRRAKPGKDVWADY